MGHRRRGRSTMGTAIGRCPRSDGRRVRNPLLHRNQYQRFGRRRTWSRMFARTVSRICMKVQETEEDGCRRSRRRPDRWVIGPVRGGDELRSARVIRLERRERGQPPQPDVIIGTVITNYASKIEPSDGCTGTTVSVRWSRPTSTTPPVVVVPPGIERIFKTPPRAVDVSPSRRSIVPLIVTPTSPRLHSRQPPPCPTVPSAPARASSHLKYVLTRPEPPSPP